MPAALAMSRTLVRAKPFSEKSLSEASRICLRVSGPFRALRGKMLPDRVRVVVTSFAPCRMVLAIRQPPYLSISLTNGRSAVNEQHGLLS